MSQQHHERHQSHDSPADNPLAAGDAQRRAAVLDQANKDNVEVINLEFTDVVGMAKSVTIPLDELAECLAHGKWFDGSAMESFARVAETDMILRPDLATYAVVPWRAEAEGDTATSATPAAPGKVARLICNVLMPSGERFEGDPRAILIEAMDAAAALGYRYDVSPELEFFLLRESQGTARDPLPHDRGGYFDLSTDLAADVRREMAAALGRMGVRIEATHHEVAAGQHELDFAPTDALRMADAVLTARYAVKAIAQRHGLWATFLPKPFYGINGSGMHTHQTLVRLSDGANAFAGNADTQYGLSAEGRHFIAGQLAHAQGTCAIVAPLVNSYKRLVPGFEAPVMISWGRVNREALVRVPRTRVTAPAEVRVELRNPDPSCNPYLAFAAMLRAGLDGIQRELPLAPPVEEGLYTLDEQSRLRRGIGLLPATLGEALAALQADPVALDALGEQIAAWLVETKTREWEEFLREVHPWELARYLPMY
jgi:glutamine synthetase